MVLSIDFEKNFMKIASVFFEGDCERPGGGKEMKYIAKKAAAR